MGRRPAVAPGDGGTSPAPGVAAHLDALVARYERPAFVASDPVALPHAFDDPRDREVIALYAALLAWGGFTGTTTPAGSGPVFAFAGICLLAGLLDLNAILRAKLTTDGSGGSISSSPVM